jgi:hypothetical protein
MKWDHGQLLRRCYRVGATSKPFDVHVELHASHGKGVSDPRTFEAARDQVLRSRGGLIEDLAGAGTTLRYEGGAVLPVIVTNAELVTTETELSSADAVTGDLSHIEATTASWLWLDHPLSRSLRPNVPHVPEGGQQTKTELLQQNLAFDSRRSIAIVNISGLDSFLKEVRSCLVASEPLSANDL